MTDVRRVRRPNRRRFLLGSAGGIASFAFGLSPTRSQPLHSTARIMVGFPAGGPSDVIARLLAEQMKAYASTTIVENRPGAGGRVVMDVVKNSAADGSIMVLTPAVALALYPHVYKSLSYNPQQDFAPVTTVSTTSMLIAVGPLVPSTVTTLADFIAWCRSHPNQSSYGSPGAGSPLHFIGVMLSRAANFEYLHVPFQGTAPSIQSLLGSQIASCISPIGSFVPHVRAGTLRALATTGAHSAARCCPMCQPLPRRDTRRSNTPNGSVFLFRRGLPAGPSRRSAACCARHCKPRKSRPGWPINRWMSAASCRPTLLARSKPTPIAGGRS